DSAERQVTAPTHPTGRCSAVVAVEREQRRIARRLAGGRVEPLVARAHGCSSAASRDDRALDLNGGTIRESGLHAITIVGAQDVANCRMVMRIVGVQSYPGVGGTIVPRDRVPQRRKLPADGRD